MKKCAILSVLCIFLLTCREAKVHPVDRVFSDGFYTVQIRQKSDTTFTIQSIYQSDTNYWDVNYPVYQFLYADIDKDGQDEILLGVIKSTRFDVRVRKRLFVFKHYDHKIRPQWLGSRLSMPLQNFFVDNDNLLVSVEIEADSTFAVGKYKWHKFGFEFIGYDARHQTKEQIEKLGYEI